MIDIFKTFELFLREPLSIFKQGLVNIVGVEDNIFTKKSAITVEMLKNKAQITVVNNNKIYNLLRLVQEKANNKEKISV